MSNVVDQTFIQTFATEAVMLYQQKFSLLSSTLDMTPNSPNLVGTSDRVQKLGLGAMTAKGRHAPIPAMNLAHSFVDIAVTDYYGLEWVDDLDQQKTNVNWRMKYAEAIASAAGRTDDDYIIASLDATIATGVAVNFGGPASGLIKSKILEATRLLNANEVPQMDRYFAIGPQQLVDLYAIPEYGNRDYVMTTPLQDGQVAQQFLGFFWVLTNRLPISGGNVRTAFAYARSSANRAVGREFETDVFWDGERQSWGIAGKMSKGAGIIQDNGVIEVLCQE